MFLRKAFVLICGVSLVACSAFAQTGAVPTTAPTAGVAPSGQAPAATAPAATDANPAPTAPVRTAPAASAPATPAQGAPAPAPTSASGLAPAPATVTTGVAGGTRVHGTITDPDGELIPGAMVTFTPNKGNGTAVQSGSDGTYSVTVAPGAYTLLVTMQGFAAYSVVNLKIPSVASTTIDASMKVGEQTQVVNVDATSIQVSVDPDQNASAMILTGKDLEALSDDPDELASELSALAGPSAGPNGGQIYVDGFTGGQLPPKSSIREIRVNQNPFSAEYDRLGYGRIEVFTKPGTDKIHGSFQINGNPSQFNTGSPLETTYQPPYHTLFMFGTLSGPLGKNASYSMGGDHRDIETDQYTNATILAPGFVQSPGSLTNCTTVACTQNFQAATYFPQIRTDINPRVDLALGSKNVLTTRYQFVLNDATNDGPGGQNLPTYLYNTSAMSNELQMSDSENFSTKLINELRFEYEREHTKNTAASQAPTISVSGAFTGGGYSGQNQSDHQDHYEIQNYTSLQVPHNFLRFGGRLRINREAQNSQANTNGNFQYEGITYTCTGTCATPTTGQGTAADNSYFSGTPSQFSLTVIHTPNVTYTLADLGLYAETDWTIKPNFVVSYGLRYETQNHINDHHDIAPRLSFSYGLGNKTKPMTVLRGGMGAFFDRFGQGQVLTLAREGQATNVETVYTVQQPGATCVPTATNFVTACGLTGITQATSTKYSTDIGLRTPEMYQFALGVDQQIGKIGTMSVNYIHSLGVHQLAEQNVGYGNVVAPEQYQYFTEGAFHQNQLMVTGNVKLARWFSMFGYYAFNTSVGDTSGTGNSFISVPGNMHADYGRTAFATKSRGLIVGSITLPYFIQVSPFLIAQSGNPYNITEGKDINGDSLYNDRPYLVPTGTPGSVSISGCGTFLTRAGTTPPAGATIVPVNYCNGPAEFAMNLRLTKTIGFGPSTAPKPTDGSGGGQGQHQHNGTGGGGGGHGGGPGGGGPGAMMSGGGNTGKRYNAAIGLQIQNVFNNEDLGTPNGTLTSPQFGQSTQLAGQPYSSSNALRRISLTASFNF